VEKSDEFVKEFLTKEFAILLSRTELLEGIECALPYGSEKENTVRVLNIMKKIANLH